MFHKKSLLLILLAAFTLLAAPAFAQDRVNKLVVRNNLKNGRQFEAVFQPGQYVLTPFTRSEYNALFKLHVISDPSDACFVRGEANSPYLLGALDPLMLNPQDAWRYFELRDTCFLRFEVRDYRKGVVNIRQVKKFKTIELTDQWKQVKFNPGHWTAAGQANYFTAEYKIDGDPNCLRYKDLTGRQSGFADRTQGGFGMAMAFRLDKPCVLQMRAVRSERDDDGKHVLVPVPQDTVVFAKSNTS